MKIEVQHNFECPDYSTECHTYNFQPHGQVHVPKTLEAHSVPGEYIWIMD